MSASVYVDLLVQALDETISDKERITGRWTVCRLNREREVVEESTEEISEVFTRSSNPLEFFERLCTQHSLDNPLIGLRKEAKKEIFLGYLKQAYRILFTRLRQCTNAKLLKQKMRVSASPDRHPHVEFGRLMQEAFNAVLSEPIVDPNYQAVFRTFFEQAPQEGYASQADECLAWTHFCSQRREISIQDEAEQEAYRLLPSLNGGPASVFTVQVIKDFFIASPPISLVEEWPGLSRAILKSPILQEALFLEDEKDPMALGFVGVAPHSHLGFAQERDALIASIEFQLEKKPTGELRELNLLWRGWILAHCSGRSFLASQPLRLERLLARMQGWKQGSLQIIVPQDIRNLMVRVIQKFLLKVDLKKENPLDSATWQKQHQAYLSVTGNLEVQGLISQCDRGAEWAISLRRDQPNLQERVNWALCIGMLLSNEQGHKTAQLASLKSSLYFNERLFAQLWEDSSSPSGKSSKSPDIITSLPNILETIGSRLDVESREVRWYESLKCNTTLAPYIRYSQQVSDLLKALIAVIQVAIGTNKRAFQKKIAMGDRSPKWQADLVALVQERDEWFKLLTKITDYPIQVYHSSFEVQRQAYQEYARKLLFIFEEFSTEKVATGSVPATCYPILYRYHVQVIGQCWSKQLEPCIQSLKKGLELIFDIIAQDMVRLANEDDEVSRERIRLYKIMNAHYLKFYAQVCVPPHQRPDESDSRFWQDLMKNLTSVTQKHVLAHQSVIETCRYLKVAQILLAGVLLLTTAVVGFLVIYHTTNLFRSQSKRNFDRLVGVVNQLGKTLEMEAQPKPFPLAPCVNKDASKKWAELNWSHRPAPLLDMPLEQRG